MELYQISSNVKRGRPYLIISMLSYHKIISHMFINFLNQYIANNILTYIYIYLNHFFCTIRDLLAVSARNTDDVRTQRIAAPRRLLTKEASRSWYNFSSFSSHHPFFISHQITSIHLTPFFPSRKSDRRLD
jgi:hypothetical protein